MLKTMLRKACIDYVELSTLLCEIEKAVNSRPLTYVSDNADELSPLAPADFVHCLPQTSDADLDEIDAKKLNKRASYEAKKKGAYKCTPFRGSKPL